MNHNWKKTLISSLTLLLLAVGTYFFLQPSKQAQANETAASATTLGGDPLPSVILQPYASDFTLPVDISNSGVSNDERLFIVEKDGVIRIIDPSGSVLPTAFLNIDGRVRSGEPERGLLGLAFHPEYDQNGYLYVNYTNNAGHTVVSRFSVTADENIADPNSEYVIIAIQQPYTNHNAGDLAFGPDNYLYIPLGDGGSGGDPEDRAQTMSEPLGKILRIDVDSGPGGSPECAELGSGNYTIPASNPYVGVAEVCDEIWATGLRNPWRVSFDRTTGDLYIGDVGQSLWEEVDFQPASSTGGENYGWRCYEGNHEYNTAGCSGQGSYDFPIFEYDHGAGQAITGGFVYRGSEHPELTGSYFFADFSAGTLWSLTPDGGGWQDKAQGFYAGSGFSSFGENVNGELFVAEYNSGTIFSLYSLPLRTNLPIILTEN
jgi:glucose/arabinose dehydrogenase